MGAVQILSHSMVQSIEENSVRKGYDPRDFALVAEGGAGPLFAVPIAIEVGTPHVIVPPYPGIAAAMGLIATDMVYEYGATTYQRLSKLDVAALQRRFEELEAQAARQLEEDGIPADRVVVQRIVDARYLGQGYELRVDVASGAIDEGWIEKVRSDFHDIHEREFTRRFEDSDIEIPNIRVRGIGLMPPFSMPELEAGDESPAAALRHEGDAWFLVDGSLEQVATRYYDRAALRAGNRLEGPAIVNQYDSTTVIPPGIAAGVDRSGNIVIDVGASAQARAVTASAPCRRAKEPDHVDARIRAREAPGPARARAGRRRSDHAARARRRVPRHREGDGGRPLPDVVLVDHPRVRGPRCRDLRRQGPRALRVGLDADAHRLAALVHPRLHAPPRGQGRRGGRDHPQPPVLRGLAHPRHRSRSPDLLGRRAARVRRRDGACPRRRRLVPGDQRGRLRRVRRGQDLRRFALVPGRRAQRRPRPHGLRQRPHRDDEPRRHERDDGRLPARPRSHAAPLPALRRRDGHERRLQLDGLLGDDAARADPQASRRGLHGADGVARRRRAQPGRAPARRDEGDRRGRRDHHRPDRVERGGADGVQRPLRRVAARRRVLRSAHDPARRGHLPRARAAERRRLPAGEGDRPERHDLQPDLPAGVLLALLPGAARRRQHDPRACGRAARRGDGGKLRRHPLLRLLGVLRGDGRVLALPRGQRGGLRRALRQGRDGLRRQPDGEHAQQPDRGARPALPDPLRPVRASPRAGRAGPLARRHRHHPPQPVSRRRRLLVRG